MLTDDVNKYIRLYCAIICMKMSEHRNLLKSLKLVVEIDLIKP